MDFNKDDFIDAVKSRRAYNAGGVEARLREPGLSPVQSITLAERQLAYVAPTTRGPGLTVHWTLAGHDLLKAAEVINTLGVGLLGRPLVRLVGDVLYRVRDDGTFRWEEKIRAEDWVRTSNVYGAEA